MHRIPRRHLLASLASMGAAHALGQAAPAPNPDITTVDPDGTAHITRTVPIPDTLSPEGQAYLARGIAWAPGAGSEQAKQLTELALRLYPVKITESVVAGVPVRFFEPPIVPAARQHHILLNLHGGGFGSDSGSMLENIPIASLTRTRVIAVLYTLSPAAKFPVAVDQAVAVYRELLKTHRPHQIAIFGTSAGASMSAQLVMRIKAEKLPVPACLGYFAGNSDFSRTGDSAAFFSTQGLRGARFPDHNPYPNYVAGHPLTDPLLSPLLGDLSHFPPTLAMCGTRDQLLSPTTNFARALRKAGVPHDLVVFDAMPHAHWYMIDIPEAREALEIQAAFFNRIFDSRQKS